jgi:hypothetical protein
MDASLSDLLKLLLGGGLVAMVTAGVAALRKYRSGEIVDDDAVIARLDKDNKRLRFQLEQKDERIEEERRGRWHAEDVAAQYRRRLSKYEDVGPEPVAPAPPELESSDE